MLFSSLSLKVLVGLGAVVGASVLSIRLKSKDTDTNTGTLNSKQGEAVVIPELDEPAMPEPEEADITLEQAAKKEIERLNKEIERVEEFKGSNSSKLLKIETNMTLLKEALKGKYDKWQEDKHKWKDSADINGEADKREADWTITNKAVDDDEKEITKLKRSIETNNQNLSDYKKELNGYTKQLDLLNKKS